MLNPVFYGSPRGMIWAMKVLDFAKDFSLFVPKLSIGPISRHYYSGQFGAYGPKHVCYFLPLLPGSIFWNCV